MSDTSSHKLSADSAAKEAHRVIAAVRSRREFEGALAAPPASIFLLAGSISELPRYISEAENAGKKLFLHMDMIEGLGKDGAAVEYVASLAPYGVISTRGNLVKQAKAAGLCTVQRFFIVDGRSVETALDTVRQTKPAFAELMPGLVDKAIRAFSDEGLSIIAGGLISTPDEARRALTSGAVAVSTSARTLWDL